MSDYRVFETEEFAKALRKLSKTNINFIQSKLTGYVYPQIKQEPCFGKNIKKLRDYNPQTWRYRLGKFRLFYAVDHEEKTIYVLTVDFRKDAYR
ncbi:type II toxin-antitoxin system RelE family toxin [Desulfobacula sp.]|uniref:type II toxin-antitoxin system RelE family toxin n=1 Tax=Desulfobacula sp. TaxID=2593537 RepID=UPI00199A5B6B|nr:type II toxin-antitoxin system RelE/ParE family toxin [Candidatus Brocadiales bacterium]MBL6996492.1 type II toxin-antitoxin system RelE/ParE family toxin [Desulfobacula sp.]